jgi:hypothetical protein
LGMRRFTPVVRWVPGSAMADSAGVVRDMDGS